MDQNNGPEAKVSNEEIRITTMKDLQESFPHLIKISLQGPTSHMRTITRTTEDQMINSQLSHSIEMAEIGSGNGSFNNSNGNWRTNGNLSPSPSTQRRDFSQNNSYRQARSDQSNNSAFHRSDN